MKKLFACSFLFLFLFATNIISAQQWTNEQKEVWKVVETYSALASSHNLNEFMIYFDDSYWGWDYSDPAPLNKAKTMELVNYWWNKHKAGYYIITPAKIWVNGNYAYVHYYYSAANETNDGKPTSTKGRWTDILMKIDGKWLIVGDHGGETK